MKDIFRSNSSVISRPIESKYRFSEIEQNVLEFIFEHVNPFDKEFQEITFHISEFYKAMGYNHHDYLAIRKALKKIQKTQIKIKEDLAIWVTYTSWLSSVTFDEDPGDVRVSINPEIKKHLTQLKSNYVKYNSEHIFQLTGSYTKQLYVFLKSVVKSPYEVKIDTLRELLCIEDKYPLYADFKRRVILYSIDEINKKTDLKVSIKEKKGGLKVKSLIFHLETQEVNETELFNPTIEFLMKKYGFKKTTAQRLLKVGGEKSGKILEEAEKYIDKQVKKGKTVVPRKVITTAFNNKWGVDKETPKPTTPDKITPPPEKNLDIFNDPDMKKRFEYFLEKEMPDFLSISREFGIIQALKMQPIIFERAIKNFKKSEYYKNMDITDLV